MNHSVKSKTIRHDCHLLVSAAPAPPATCLVLQRFKPNRHDWNPRGGRAAGSPEPRRFSPKTSCFVFHGGSRLEGPAPRPAPTTPPGTVPTARFAQFCSSLGAISGNGECICTPNQLNNKKENNPTTTKQTPNWFLVSPAETQTHLPQPFRTHFPIAISPTRLPDT